MDETCPDGIGDGKELKEVRSLNNWLHFSYFSLWYNMLICTLVFNNGFMRSMTWTHRILTLLVYKS